MFRDGTYLEQPDDDRYSKHDESAEHNPSAFRDLLDYLDGTDENPKKHYPLWFRLMVNDEDEFMVHFDFDGDAYILCPDGNMLMTEFKLRSARPVYYRKMEWLPATDERECLAIGFGFTGKNTCDQFDGKVIEIYQDGRYIVADIADI